MEISSSVDTVFQEIGSSVDADIPGIRFRCGYRYSRKSASAWTPIFQNSVPAWIPIFQREYRNPKGTEKTKIRSGGLPKNENPKIRKFWLRVRYIGFGFRFFKRWIYGFGLWFLGIGYGFRLSVLGLWIYDFGFRFLGFGYMGFFQFLGVGYIDFGFRFLGVGYIGSFGYWALDIWISAFGSWALNIWILAFGSWVWMYVNNFG
ncbi:uncharacterized protein OCT59_002092 [Rhizophagus irregularis]|uniref:uncharacterized protein n=1 Tax=Rhizophagus irregularis TaxID=588596 RepID=UPI003331886C|nr:hypothetical protein OCT59_002092 [Rhizophagus irregularis]